jgi:hypothetical protein
MPKARGVTVMLATILASISGGACAMTQSNNADRCRVIGGEKLPADVGGSQSLCDAIEAAAASRAPGAEFTAEIEVVSPSSLSANVRLGNGTLLPKQELSVSDRQLNRSSIGRFASAIADVIGQARN